MSNKRGGNFNHLTFGGAGNQADNLARLPTEIDEDLDERDEDGLIDADVRNFQLKLAQMDESEAKAIESIREEEFNKHKVVKEEDRLQSYL